MLLSSLLRILLKTLHKTRLKEGQPAPAFSAVDQEGKTIRLEDFKGKKVILFFYPRDNTPGCTAQACNLRDNFRSLKRKGYVVIGVSADNEKSHQRFRKKFDLPYPLIADTDHKLIKSYDVWGKKKFIGIEFEGIVRTTFVISESGIIEKIISDVKTKDHAAQILNSN